MPQGITLERAVQFIKGGFAYQAHKQFGIPGEIWQTSFLDRRVRDASEFLRFKHYIHQNPVRAGLVSEAGNFPYSSARAQCKLDEVPQWLKPNFGAAALMQA